MTLSDYCDALNLVLVVKRYPNQNERWSADVKEMEIIEVGYLLSTYSEGKTPQEAINAFLKNIRGKRCVINAHTHLRRDFVVPKNIELMEES